MEATSRCPCLSCGNFQHILQNTQGPYLDFQPKFSWYIPIYKVDSVNAKQKHLNLENQRILFEQQSPRAKFPFWTGSQLATGNLEGTQKSRSCSNVAGMDGITVFWATFLDFIIGCRHISLHFPGPSSNPSWRQSMGHKFPLEHSSMDGWT